MARRTARPTLTEQVIDAMAHNLALGMGTDQAARLSGIAPSTFYKWQKEGRDELERREAGERPQRKLDLYVDLVERTETARAACQARLLSAVINQLEGGDYKAATWLLERKWPAEFGRVNRTEISGPDGGPVRQETTVNVTDAELFGLADRIAGLGPVLPGAE